MRKHNIIFAVIISIMSFQAQALEKIMSHKVVNLPVDLSLAKVKFTNKGYGEIYLVKILVPELASETLLNHRNEGEGAPCLATYAASTVDEVVQNNPAKEIYPFTIDVKKVLHPNETNKTCLVYLREDIETVVRGFKFIHSRDIQLPSRHIDDCN